MHSFLKFETMSNFYKVRQFDLISIIIISANFQYVSKPGFSQAALANYNQFKKETFYLRGGEGVLAFLMVYGGAIS